MNKNILKFLAAGLIFVSACDNNKEFEEPNKKEVKTGISDAKIPVDTAMKLLNKAEKMSKIWSQDSVLVGINGNNVSIEGLTIFQSKASQWIYTYFSPKISKTYNVVFRGDGTATWLESSGNYNTDNNIANFSVDSNKAIDNAMKAGLPIGKTYSMELSKNSKGMNWYVGSKQDDMSSKFTVKTVDALSGNVK